jgi:hypothetical protein
VTCEHRHYTSGGAPSGVRMGQPVIEIMSKLYLVNVNSPNVECSGDPNDAHHWPTQEEAQSMCNLLNRANISSQADNKQLRQNYRNFRIEDFGSDVLIACDYVAANQL